MAQTPAVATAEREGIRFTLHEYAHDPTADGALAVAMVPVAAQLDLKALGGRKELPAHVDVIALAATSRWSRETSSG